MWNPDIRPLVDEAWRSYNAGAYRAAIAATWTAVVVDLIDKIAGLAEAGDGEAIRFTEKVRRRATPVLARSSRCSRSRTPLLDLAARLELGHTVGLAECGSAVEFCACDRRSEVAGILS